MDVGALKMNKYLNLTLRDVEIWEDQEYDGVCGLYGRGVGSAATFSD